MLVGLLFSAAIYPVSGGLSDPAHSDTGDTLMMGLYLALGIFLLMAVRNPSAHRSLIAFAAWSSFAHAGVMSVLGFEIATERVGFLVGSAVHCCHRRSPDSVASGKGASRAPSSSNCIRH